MEERFRPKEKVGGSTPSRGTCVVSPIFLSFNQSDRADGGDSLQPLGIVCDSKNHRTILHFASGPTEGSGPEPIAAAGCGLFLVKAREVSDATSE